MQAWTSDTGNLSPGAANRRVRHGIVALAVGLAVAVLMQRYMLGWAWRGLLIIPFFAAGSGFLNGFYRS